MTMGLSFYQQKIYSREDLIVLNLFEQPVWIFDIEKKAMWWANAAALELWSADCLASLLKRDFAHDMSEVTAYRLADYLVRFRKGDRIKDQWTFYPNGVGPKTYLTTASGIRIEEGRTAMLMEGVPKDTRDIQGQASLRGVEMLRDLPIAVCLLDIDGNVIDQNPEALVVFGSIDAGPVDAGPEYECDKERKTSPPNSHFVDRFVDKEFGRSVLENVVPKQGKISFEALQYTVNGPRWCAIKIRHTIDPVTNNPIMLYSARDITAVVEAKKEADRARREADRANMAKSEFIAVMAHEIRTPLHQLTGVIELMDHTNLDKEQKQFIRLMQSSAVSLMTVINDILDYTKLEAGKISLENIAFDVKAVVEGSLAAIGPTAEKRRLSLDSVITNEIPPLVVGDPNRLRQILLNLLQNAVKFTHDGSISVRLSRSAATKNPGRIALRFVVSDTGIGIHEDQWERIFCKYQQGDSSTARKYGGTGLGLPICKSLVEVMGGSIGMESEVGKGTTFWFEIPFEQLTDQVEPSQDYLDLACDEKNLRILLVEDNKVNQKVMTAMLKRMGHSVTSAWNGQEAIDCIETETYDIVLMDVEMPVMDGMEATKEIRRRGWTLEMLPILGLTAGVRRQDLQETGMNDWLTKPVGMKVIKTAIHQAMTMSDRTGHTSLLELCTTHAESAGSNNGSNEMDPR
jgi:signal transduction histidine kinase/ActR/RegA family two-component response regulator